MYELHEYPEYKWAMAIDIEACNGCSACVAACYIENNVGISGPQEHLKGREMSWIRLEPYVIEKDGMESMEFVPMLCQQCDNAPCESVCPVLASIHNSEGLNIQVYNRCVGTRYCANNCPYKVRRFNWFDWVGWPEERILIDNSVIYGGQPLGDVSNPAVTRRPRGVMEKCTFCIHRIREAKDRAKDENRKVRDGEITPACAETCPTDAIVFGNIKDKNSRVYKLSQEKGAHRILDHELNTKPSVYYLGKKG
ncbi:MAG: 4Fe-4S dicluster domain-containing protein [Planctomycetota bacterium]|nr:MAG: 4Fe-4S dicluster domain-containing protein [Planctomycetota bacterium]